MADKFGTGLPEGWQDWPEDDIVEYLQDHPQPVPAGVIQWEHQNSKGKILDTHENFRILMKATGVKIRQNLMEGVLEFSMQGMSFPLGTSAKRGYLWMKSLAAKYSFPTGTIAEHMGEAADSSPFHPVREMLTRTKWDGVSRLDDLVETLNCTDPQFARMVLDLYMVGAVASVMRPQGAATAGIIVLQGAQGCGKTQWFKRLFMDEAGFCKDSVILDLKDKDSIRKATRAWAVELGEIESTMRRSGAGFLKAFITAGEDEDRQPYAKAAERIPRRTVFFGTVNDSKFLIDRTGNRRYWVIETKGLIDWEHSIDIQQLWAEYAHKWRNGERWHPNGEELDAINSTSAQHETENPYKELILSAYRWDLDNRTTKRTVEVIRDCGGHPTSKREIRECFAALQDLDVKQSKQRGTTAWEVPTFLR